MKLTKILIIIQRSNGDVFLSSPLIEHLYKHYINVQIDLLINDDTLAIAKTLKHINNIILFSYQEKKNHRFKQEKRIIKSIYNKYDISINLTASDRSVLYSILASKYPISAIEKGSYKSWWKKLFLKKYYEFDFTKYILYNNTMPLKLLGIPFKDIIITANTPQNAKNSIEHKLSVLGIDKFLIFHPSAQYQYKIYPKQLRDELLHLLNTLQIPIIVTGSKNEIDLKIKGSLPKLDNILDFIGDTTLEEYIALSEVSLGYIGMDTLNMHIAAAQNKKIFAIFGPTILSMWSPWSNQSQENATMVSPKQTYGNVTLFQADMPCVACGKAGCDDKHGDSKCLERIDPYMIYEEVRNWLTKLAS